MYYEVYPGDTLWTIARKYGITMFHLLVANPEITNPNLIYYGQLIRIPLGVLPDSIIYTIRPNDTLWMISRYFALTLDQLLQSNPQIVTPSLIYIGQQINISSVAPPPNTRLYAVQSGDTLYKIARRLGTTDGELLRLNLGITNPNLIYLGQRIVVPIKPETPPGCIV
ncbi:MAG: LysM peptidoglycan-binding domain-containing protein [Halanaerobiales bacterium]|nr:LysM peptidoglycan-binding domain-containing protein [Halanaerobiales bacterium]